MATKSELFGLLLEVWEAAENCGGSRAEMSACLDEIQEMIEEQIPDVAEEVEASYEDE
jgi:hypothetical protein